MNDTTTKQNPLAYAPIGKLIAKFAIPAIISFLVTSIYNIADQIFIGRGVGVLGNAATNVAFPLVMIVTSLSLFFGIGSASNFNLRLGEGKKEEAAQIAGTGLTLMILSGVILTVIVAIILDNMLYAFGATENVFSYAKTYTSITNIGIAFQILTVGGCQLIRADGSPTYSMAALLSGAVLNIILDPILIFNAQMGIAGGALATVIGQIVSAVMVVLYFPRFKTIKLKLPLFKPNGACVKRIMMLGAAASINQIAMSVVQITLNNTLTYYGGLSHYGADIPLAAVGVITKVNMLFMGFAIGVAQGAQPIVGFNYGAANYERVKAAFLRASAIVMVISVVFFLAFQIFPRQIVSIFGEGSEEYFAFSERYFKIYLFMTFINGFQPVVMNFFTSIGKANKGILLSLTRQIIFLMPLILIFPKFWGVDGIMYAGPIADGAAAALAIGMAASEILHMAERDPKNKLKAA